MSYKVGIYSEDFHYGIKLMEYINGHENIPFRMAVFSSEQAFSDYMQKITLDFLLLGDEQTKDVKYPHGYITGNRGIVDNVRYVYKYQNVNNIVEYITRVLMQGSNTMLSDNRIYAVYSPIGRVGKTTLSLGICSYYRDCLYISMEDYRSLSVDSISPAEREQGELFFYYLMSRNEDIREVLTRLPKASEGFSMAFSDRVGFMDLRQIKKEDLQWFFRLMPEKNGYSRIVIDVGTGAVSDLNILTCADRIFVPVIDEEGAACKLEHFRAMAEADVEFTDRITYISVPCAKYNSEGIAKLIETGGI